MFALRRAAIATVAPIAKRSMARPFSVLGARFAGGGDVTKELEKNIGPGARAGEVPTDLDQATGLEREELLAKLQGKERFDVQPLNMTHLGTINDPIVVQSHDAIRFVGCTGYPAESHDTIWISLNKAHDYDRCPECGSVYKMDFVGSEGDNHH